MKKLLNKLKEQLEHCEEIKYPDVLVRTEELRMLLDYTEQLEVDAEELLYDASRLYDLNMDDYNES